MTRSSTLDLAGGLDQPPHFFMIQKRITQLVDRYISREVLRDRLEDLPVQFQTPQPRPWQPIDWQAIHPDQVIEIDLGVFLSIITGAMDTEAPIRGYTQTSRQYLEPLHPQMARFVGGVVDSNGTLLEPGLWEKEERQHSPALAKLYYQLSGEKAVPHYRIPKAYQPSPHAYAALYRHGFHRVMTEYSAVCLYLWLMAHTTGAVQRLFEELLLDEVNHMTKFWGFGVWAYPGSAFDRFRPLWVPSGSGKGQRSSPDFLHSLRDLTHTLHRMMGTLNWKAWPPAHKSELILTFIHVMHRLWTWNQTLTPDYLKDLLGQPPLQR